MCLFTLSYFEDLELVFEHRICLTALGNSADDVVVLDVIGVVGLDVGSETVESALDSFLGGRVHHTGILRRVIRAPSNKRNLVPRALRVLQLILDIEDGISSTDALLPATVLALCIEQLFAECRPVAFSACLFDDDFLPVVADFVDDPFCGFAEFEIVEGLDTFGRDGDS